MHKLIRLTFSEFLLLIRAFTLVMLVRVMLVLVPYKKVIEIMRRFSSGRVMSDDSTDPGKLAWAVRAAGRRLLGGKPCLTEALVLDVLLRRRGISSEIRLGVTKGQNGALLAHAWVESNGRVVIGRKSSEFIYTRLEPLRMDRA